MSDRSPASADTGPRAIDGPARTDGVLVSRAVAYIVDFFIVGALVLIVSMGVAFLGLLTFGLGWMLFPDRRRGRRHGLCGGDHRRPTAGHLRDARGAGTGRAG